MTYITRKQYMDGEASHSEYYGEICESLGYVWHGTAEQLAILTRAVQDGNESFNKLDKMPTPSYWDCIAPQKMNLRPELQRRGDQWSLSGGLCCAKEAARRAVNLSAT